MTRSKIAVIGSGLAGISAAHFLNDKFDVTLYEEKNKVGMGIYTTEVENEGHLSVIDIPLRIFTPGYYPHLMKLYQEVGVELEFIDHSSAYADENNQIFFHYGNCYWGQHSLSYPKIELKNIGTQISIYLTLGTFYKNAEKDLLQGGLDEVTFETYLKRYHYSNVFIKQILLPPLSATCTCDYQSVLNYPAKMLLEYLTCGVLKQGVIKATKGVIDITNRLLRGVHVECSSQLMGIEYGENKVILSIEKNGEKQTTEVDYVIVACQPHETSQILEKSSHHHDKFLKEKLQQIPIEKSQMVLHCDQSLRPKSLYKVSPINFFLEKNAKRCEVTVDMSRSTPSLREFGPIFQTWNPVRKINPKLVLGERSFTRPVVNLMAQKAVSQIREFQRNENHRLLLCGSYMSDKIPLLDAAVASSLDIMEKMRAL